MAQVGARRFAAPPAGATDLPKLDLFKVAERYRALLEAGDQLGILPMLESSLILDGRRPMPVPAGVSALLPSHSPPAPLHIPCRILSTSPDNTCWYNPRSRSGRPWFVSSAPNYPCPMYWINLKSMHSWPRWIPGPSAAIPAAVEEAVAMTTPRTRFSRAWGSPPRWMFTFTTSNGPSGCPRTRCGRWRRCMKDLGGILGRRCRGICPAPVAVLCITLLAGNE